MPLQQGNYAWPSEGPPAEAARDCSSFASTVASDVATALVVTATVSGGASAVASATGDSPPATSVASAALGSSTPSGYAGATPSSDPSAACASASNSFRLGSSSRSDSPNRIKNCFDVRYRIGRPITALRPAVVMSRLSRSVLITPPTLTPRISLISGTVTGCL